MRDPPFRLAVAVSVGAVLASFPTSAEPALCADEASVSPCFDADALWQPTGTSSFASLPSPRPLAPGTAAFALGAGLAYRPIVLVAPAPDPAGLTIPVVRTTTTLTIGVGFGLTDELDVRVAMPFVPYQEGSGIESVTSSRATALQHAGVRDPRLALHWAFFDSSSAVVGARLELAVPLGDEELFAGAAGPTLAPALNSELTLGRFVFAADVGLRLRQAVHFATLRKGSEAVLGAGAAFDVVAQPRLTLGVEAWLRPGLAGAAPSSDLDTLDLPAEWLASLGYAWEPEGPWSLALAGGSGLPLSTGRAPDGERAHFAGVTTPTFRAVAALRFARR